MSGVFITFEGIDQAGKSTQIEKLVKRLKKEYPDREIVQSFEPGATELGAKLRNIILHEDAISAHAELLLYLADRAENVNKVLVPALSRGCIVISDRYIDSTVAYQCSGRVLDRSTVLTMTNFATSGLLPDLTILLDITVEESKKRLLGLNADRLEQENNEFFEQVRSGYLKIAHDEKRVHVFDAMADIDKLSEDIYEVVSSVMV
ncbi:MAG: dTMP kinase [Candidatus Ancillula sp.]|nr:dTMP kinase [Candidatus Ancillula sp.]